MDVRITPHQLAGSVRAISSKSMLHRSLILAALAQGRTLLAPELACVSQDVEATLSCLCKLGLYLASTREGLLMLPISARGPRRNARLDVGESGSTLRFLLPVVAALGTGARITCHGRLADRPLAPLDAQLEAHGVTLAWDEGVLKVSGQLTPGRFTLPGNVSSQFVSGLLMAAPLLDGPTTVVVSEPIESRAYIDLTLDALAAHGVAVTLGASFADGSDFSTFEVAGDACLRSPGVVTTEGDWSNAAFWLAAGAIGDTPVSVSGLNLQSHQADRQIMPALSLLGARVSRGNGSATAIPDRLIGRDISVSAIPDLAAPLAALAAVSAGTTRLTGAARLRLKESDRLETIRQTLVSMGGNADIVEDSLVIEGVPRLTGGTVDAANDHRIAMMAAVCAAYAAEPTTIVGADCVAKSYPTFFQDFRSLGGIAEEM